MQAGEHADGRFIGLAHTRLLLSVRPSSGSGGQMILPTEEHHGISTTWTTATLHESSSSAAWSQ